MIILTYANSRIRQILGDYVRGASADDLAMRAMVATFEGSPGVVAEEAPFLSLYGWAAIAFDDDDLRGVYALGDPQILAPDLVSHGGERQEAEQGSSPLPDLRNVFAPLGRLFRRSEGKQPEDEAETEELEQLEAEPDDGLQEAQVDVAVTEMANVPFLIPKWDTSIPESGGKNDGRKERGGYGDLWREPDS